SGLLMAAPFADGDTRIDVEGNLVSVPYVEMTLNMLRQWGYMVEFDGGRQFRIPGGQRAGTAHYDIEPDASAASYFWGAAALAGGQVTVPGLGGKCLQGDVRFVDILEQMGARVTRSAQRIRVEGRPLHGVDVDLNDISDTVMTLAAVACFA